MGDRPQGIINRQLVDIADVLIGVFWTRLGTPTGEAESGTVEEIERFIAADKPVLLYFSNQPVLPGSVDPAEYSRLLEFKKSLRERGLYDTYESEAELWRKAPSGVTRVMRDYFRLESVASSAAEAVARPSVSLIARVDRERELSGFNKQGRPQYRTRERLVIENNGDAAAEQLEVSFENAPGVSGDPPQTWGNDGPVGWLVAGGSVEYPLLLHMGIAPQWEVVLRWTEEGQPREERQTMRA
jgi:hypothetical protein